MRPVFGVFYLNRGKWTGPAHGELVTKEDIIWNSGLEGKHSMSSHIECFLRACRRQKRKPVQLKKQTWQPI